MAVHLGLVHGGHPRWFYELDREDQVSVLAYHLSKQPKKDKGTRWYGSVK